MKIGLVIACNLEMEEHLKYFQKIKEIKKANFIFYKAKFAGHKIFACKSGPTEINAGIFTQALIDNFDVDVIINSGTCGGLDKNLKVGDVLVIEKASFWDISADIIQPSTYFCNEKLKDFALLQDKSLIAGNLATGNSFIDSEELKTHLISKFGVNCCDMEGVAVVYTCQKNNIPSLMLKAVSDSGNMEEFEINVSKASAKVAKCVFKCIENLK